MQQIQSGFCMSKSNPKLIFLRFWCHMHFIPLMNLQIICASVLILLVHLKCWKMELELTTVQHFTCFITFFQKKSIYVVWFRCNIPLLVWFFCLFRFFLKVNTIIKLTEKYNIHRVIYCTCFPRVAHYSIDLPGIFVLSYDLVTNSYRHTKFNVRKEKFSLLSSAESNHRK